MAASLPIVLIQQFLIVLGLQAFGLSMGRILAVAPNVFLAWVLCLGWMGLGTTGIAAGFLCGLLYDGLSRGQPGWSSLLLVLIAYGNCFVRRPPLSLKAAVAFAASAVYAVLLSFSPGRGFTWSGMTLFRFSVLFAVYNTCVTLAIDALAARTTWRRKGSSRF